MDDDYFEDLLDIDEIMRAVDPDSLDDPLNDSRDDSYYDGSRCDSPFDPGFMYGDCDRDDEADPNFGRHSPSDEPLSGQELTTLLICTAGIGYH